MKQYIYEGLKAKLQALSEQTETGNSEDKTATLLQSTTESCWPKQQGKKTQNSKTWKLDHYHLGAY